MQGQDAREQVDAPAGGRAPAAAQAEAGLREEGTRYGQDFRNEV